MGQWSLGGRHRLLQSRYHSSSVAGRRCDGLLSSGSVFAARGGKGASSSSDRIRHRTACLPECTHTADVDGDLTMDNRQSMK